jgi:glutathione S-transferase
MAERLTDEELAKATRYRDIACAGDDGWMRELKRAEVRAEKAEARCRELEAPYHGVDIDECRHQNGCVVTAVEDARADERRKVAREMLLVRMPDRPFCIGNTLSLLNLLPALADAVDHLLDRHDCDHERHNDWRDAGRAVRAWAERFIAENSDAQGGGE